MITLTDEQLKDYLIVEMWKTLASKGYAFEHAMIWSVDKYNEMKRLTKGKENE